MKRGIKRLLLLGILLGLVFATQTTVVASPGWVSPTGFVDSGSVWTAEPSEVIELRTETSKTNYLGDNKYSMDTKIGSVHYKNNPRDTLELWKEINNQFISALAPWDWQMLEDGYHTYVLNDFTAGQVLKFESQGSTVAFQPMGLLWTNNLNQLQLISMPQTVPVSVINTPVELLPGMSGSVGTIRWDNAYGNGRDFEWTNSPGRLNKTLRLETKLPVPPQYIIDGGNPMLKLDFIFDPSPDLDIYVNGQLWDKSSKTQTIDVITFKDWYFLPVKYWDSSEEGNEGIGITELRNVGGKLYASALVPYSWLQTAVYPIFIDPAIQTHSTPKTLYFERVELSSKVWQTGESAPSSANEVTSIQNKTTVAGNYFAFIPGITNNLVSSFAFTEGDADGAHGWRSQNTYTGSFSINNWTISFKLKNRAKYAHAGTVNARIYKTTVANPAVGDLVKLNSVDGVSATVTFPATAGNIQNGTVTVWVNQNLMLDNEYLFIVLNWKVTTAGSNVQAGVLCVVNEGSAEQVVTADYFEGSPLEVQVGASADDAHEKESDGTVAITSTSVGNVSDLTAAGRYWGGYRFVSAEFPAQGTTIDVAYLRVYIFNVNVDDANFNIHFQKLAAPVAFSTTAYNITGRTRTTASTPWIANGIAAGGAGWYNSPSLCGVGSPAQEVFDAYSPTTMVVITRPNTNTYKSLYVYSYDQAGNVSGAILHLEWEAVGGPNISNLPNNQDFGIVSGSDIPETGLTYFTVTNNSGGAVTIFISGTDAIGGTTHTLSDTATPGHNIFGLKAGLEGGDYTIVVRKTEAFNTLVSGLAPEGTQRWGLRLYTPTTFTNEDAQKTLTVTLSVILD